MRFYDTRVLAMPREGLHVQWQLEPEDTDMSSVEVELQRSESPLGPFEVLQAFDPVSVFAFTDKTVPWRPKGWEIYYRLVARDKTSGDVVHESRAFGMQGQLPLDALEIIRQHNIMLRGVNGHGAYNGTLCTVYKRRNFGARCVYCVDAQTGRVTISGCRSCGGTGFSGTGYYAPVDVFIALQPNARNPQITMLGKLEDNETSGYLVNFPVLYGGDLIVEPSESHWRVVAVEPTLRHRVIVRQSLRLRQLDHNDVEYETLRHSSHR